MDCYVIRKSVLHHNYQRRITMKPLSISVTQRLYALYYRLHNNKHCKSFSCWYALPRLFLPRLTYFCFRNNIDNHGTSQPLPWCRQWEPFTFTQPGSAHNNSSTPKVPIPYTKNRSASCSLSGIYQNIPGSFPPGTLKGRGGNRGGISCLTDIIPFLCPFVNSGLCFQIHFFHVRRR